MHTQDHVKQISSVHDEGAHKSSYIAEEVFAIDGCDRRECVSFLFRYETTSILVLKPFKNNT